MNWFWDHLVAMQKNINTALTYFHNMTLSESVGKQYLHIQHTWSIWNHFFPSAANGFESIHFPFNFGLLQLLREICGQTAAKCSTMLTSCLLILSVCHLALVRHYHRGIYQNFSIQTSCQLPLGTKLMRAVRVN